jgi:hypothetical protein
MSPEDMNAFAEARIAALRAGLKLSAEQERLWPLVEEALRSLANLHLTSMQAMRQGQARMEDDPINALRSMSDRMAEGAAAMRKLADAAAPLYASLDEAQRRRLRVLARDMGPRGIMGGPGRGMMRGWFGGRDDDEDDD